MAGKPWTQPELDYLVEHYAENMSTDLAKTLNRPLSSVYQKAYSFGLKKNPELIQAIGKMSSGNPNVIASRFQKGHNTYNKGKKMPNHVYEQASKTMFKPGHLPHNTRPEGDGAKSKRKGYWWIRIALGKWRQLHTYTWEQANRPIDPKTEMVKFKDGNRDNCDIDNLYLCTRAENMRSNSIHRYPKELKDTIRTISKFKRKIKQYEKRHHGGSEPTD